MSKLNFYLKLLKTVYKKYINQIIAKKNDNFLCITVQASQLNHLISSLEKNSITQLKSLNDICIVDYPEKANRFEVSYNLLSIKYNLRFFIKTYTSSYITSISSIFASANWLEREC